MNFSVLLSVYNKECPDYLSGSFESLLEQSVRPNEVVLVKDGPLTPELEAVIDDYVQKMPYLKVVPLKSNQGLGKALNEGLKHCTNDIVARMDTDDICMPNRFEKQLKVFELCPETDVVGAWISEFEGDPCNVISVRKLPETHDEIFAYGKVRCPINHPVVMFKKNAVLAAGGYMHLLLFEDYYLWVRMLLNGARFYNIQEPLLYFRASEEMFMRRGGYKYAKTEASFLWKMYKIGYVGFVPTVKNIAIRFTVRIMPNKLRSVVYKKILR